MALEPQPQPQPKPQPKPQPQPQPETETELAVAPFPAGYWALPLTTIVLERVSPSRMSWKKEKEKKPQVHAAPTHTPWKPHRPSLYT